MARSSALRSIELAVIACAAACAVPLDHNAEAAGGAGKGETASAALGRTGTTLELASRVCHAPVASCRYTLGLSLELRRAGSQESVGARSPVVLGELALRLERETPGADIWFDSSTEGAGYDAIPVWMPSGSSEVVTATVRATPGTSFAMILRTKPSGWPEQVRGVRVGWELEELCELGPLEAATAADHWWQSRVVDDDQLEGVRADSGSVSARSFLLRGRTHSGDQDWWELPIDDALGSFLHQQGTLPRVSDVSEYPVAVATFQRCEDDAQAADPTLAGSAWGCAAAGSLYVRVAAPGGEACNAPYEVRLEVPVPRAEEEAPVPGS